ncbi:MAG: ferrous iron transport protein A [Clostridiales Family XIII bacterium]|nr:ferrous iron transport protein A [Clostridiales Family XIII bacterium]
MSLTLKDVPVGQSATILKIGGEGAVKRRIMDMGITKGAEVSVRKVAPLGDPIEIRVRGYELSLRKSDAEMITVTADKDMTGETWK